MYNGECHWRPCTVNRNNLLSSHFTECGMAVVVGPYDGCLYLCQLFPSLLLLKKTELKWWVWTNMDYPLECIHTGWRRARQHQQLKQCQWGWQQQTERFDESRNDDDGEDGKFTIKWNFGRKTWTSSSSLHSIHFSLSGYALTQVVVQVVLLLPVVGCLLFLDKSAWNDVE